MKTASEKAADINKLLSDHSIENDYVNQGECHAWVIKPHQYVSSYVMGKLVAIYSGHLNSPNTMHIPAIGGLVFSIG